MKWIKVKDQLPPKNTLVWVKRMSNKYEEEPIYLGMRNGNGLSNNPDASRECYWYGSRISEFKYEQENNWGFKFSSSFSDVTVIGWANIKNPV